MQVKLTFGRGAPLDVSVQNVSAADLARGQPTKFFRLPQSIWHPRVQTTHHTPGAATYKVFCRTASGHGVALRCTRRCGQFAVRTCTRNVSTNLFVLEQSERGFSRHVLANIRPVLPRRPNHCCVQLKLVFPTIHRSWFKPLCLRGFQPPHS